MCTLRAVPPNFEADTGRTVTLNITPIKGSILFLTAKYAGKDLVPLNGAVSTVTFPVVKGVNAFSTVFTFTDTATGAGRVDEDCGGGQKQLIRNVHADDPFLSFDINGK